MTGRILTALLLAAWAFPAAAQEAILAPDVRLMPGAQPTPWLRYRNPAARTVEVTGGWDRWQGRFPMTRQADGWALDTRPLRIPFGRHEYKFIVNGQWEPGENRLLHANAESLLEKPSELVISATIDDRDLINVYLRKGIADPAKSRIWLEPELPLASCKIVSAAKPGNPESFMTAGPLITFLLNETTYGQDIPPDALVAVAGNFNGWSTDGGGGRWALRDPDGDNVWTLTTQRPGLRPPLGEAELQFKFVVNRNRWLSPPGGALNTVSDGKGNTNLRIDPEGGANNLVEIRTAQPLDLGRSWVVAIEGLGPRTIRCMATPDRVFERPPSEKPLGAILEPVHGATTYRLFAPRARSVHLCLYDTPQYEVQKPAYRRLPPQERYPLWKDEADGVWEISLLGLDVGRYYVFNVDGPYGDGESFNADAAVGDPYGRATAHAANCTMVMEPPATNQWFAGWTDEAWRPPKHEDAVIYETHVRDLTIHPSSKVPAARAGKFAGIAASAGTGTGLDHLKALGVNTIELLPVAEYDNGVGDYNWGYATTFFFAPEASYARDPLRGSQYHEFKQMVDDLHRHGFSVILDVVYNHAGWPNVFSLMDKKYFFRLNPDYTYSNFSGVGNDFRTESPMMRRLIVDNVLYWMNEHHVDGFRFDLAELVDLETMMAVRDAARAVNPNVLLIAEPWSFRGENKHQLRGAGWSAWNNDFRYAAKDFARGRGDREGLIKTIFGSVDTWAATPLQPVNYVESHDDMALADELSTAPNHDGSQLIPRDVKANRLAATVLFTSLGIPMIGEGQEFLRSKRGIPNTYNKGDELNALNWKDRERPGAAESLAYYAGLIQLRQSPAGASFRVAQRPPREYYRWIRPANGQALGYVVNSPRLHKGAGFVVLLNAASDPVTFDVPLPRGRWRMIGDGEKIVPAGIPGAPTLEGPYAATVKVPPLTAVILQDGF